MANNRDDFDGFMMCHDVVSCRVISQLQGESVFKELEIP